MGLTMEQPREAATGPRGHGQDGQWGECEVLLVADRTHGSTHRFFGDRRFEVVMTSGEPAAGTVLFTVQPSPREMAASGWRYELFMLEEGRGLVGRDIGVFSWKAVNAPSSPDPLAVALEQVRDWLGAGGWHRDGTNAERYVKPRGTDGTRPARVEAV